MLADVTHDETRRIVGFDHGNAVADAIDLDLDERLEPQHAAAAGAHDLDLTTVRRNRARDCGSDIVGANRYRRGVARNEDLRGHTPTS
jgi:hypothetical protein